MRAYWLTCCVVCLAIGGCCGGQIVADEVTLQSAKSQLNAAKNPLDAIKKLSDQTSAANAEEAAINTTLPQAAEVEPTIKQDLIVEPIPDPISTPPEIRFETLVSATESAPRLPRALLLHGEGCIHCVNLERELGELCGDSSAPVQIVKTWLANDLEKLGVTPSMMIHGTPLLIVLDKDGKIHSLSPSGFGCYLSGYKKREEVIRYLSLPEHGVDLTPTKESSPLVVATVANASSSPETFAAVLSLHLMRSSGHGDDADPGHLPVGALFDFTVNVEDSWKQLALKILTAQKIEFPAAGLLIDWSGPTRSFAVTKNSLTITPAVKMTVSKWVFKYSVGLNGLTFTDDLSSVTMDLSGAPDITIKLVSK